jgi:hypothetical protein
MTQTIDPVKLKAAAEHLEWVCQQYPNNEDVQGLYQGLLPMIEDAKAGRVLESVDWQAVPFKREVSGERYFDGYRNPSIESAYVQFSIQMEGGQSELEKQLIAKFSAMEIAELNEKAL